MSRTQRHPRLQSARKALDVTDVDSGLQRGEEQITICRRCRRCRD